MEYLLTAATPFSIAAAHRLLAGTTPGVTGMASAFKDAAGCGSLDLTGTPVDGGYRLSGSIRWASNLYDDSLMITAASTEAGEKLIVALPLNTSGVVLGDHFSLLAMGSTASSYLKLQDAFIASEQVLSADFLGFLTAVRPTFLVLQSAMCLGLTQTTLAQSKLGLTGVNAVFAAEVDEVEEKLALRSRRWSVRRRRSAGRSRPARKTC